jgi:hypothetical protein
LDCITTEEVQRLKHHLRDKAPKTVNNVLTVLNTLLEKALEWGESWTRCPAPSGCSRIAIEKMNG